MLFQCAEDMCEGAVNLDLVLDYILWAWTYAEEEHAPELMLAACSLAWPDRDFAVCEKRRGTDLVRLDAIADVDTGENARWLYCHTPGTSGHNWLLEDCDDEELLAQDTEELQAKRVKRRERRAAARACMEAEAQQ